jgi:predicted small lipoprotein YifL
MRSLKIHKAKEQPPSTLPETLIATPAMISTPRIIASFTAFALLGACGLKGPLYLPKEPAEEQASAQSQKPATPTAAKKQATPAQSPSTPKTETSPDNPTSAQ